MSDQETIVTSAIRVIAQQIKDDEIDGVKAISELLEHQVQAREQHPSTSRGYLMGYKAALTELLGELPTAGGRLADEAGGYNDCLDDVVSVIEKYREGP